MRKCVRIIRYRMVLSTEWSQVEVIDLVNDGSGLGFGIVGGRSTGVVIKSILPGGIADKDNRLQSGDHILQIGDVSLRGFSADQVASVLRQAGPQVRLVVARPVEPSSDFQVLTYSAPVVPTKILTDPEELDRQLLENGYEPIGNFDLRDNFVENDNEQQAAVNIEPEEVDIPNNPNPVEPNASAERNKVEVSPDSIKRLVHEPIELEYTLPEHEKFTIELQKNEYGLGITIAGYVCEREELSGIFVKSLSECCDAFKCQKICINDRIIEVDGDSLENVSNFEAVERLRQTGDVVRLTLERYLRGPKFEQLREALASQEQDDISPPSPSVTTLSWIPIESIEVHFEPEGASIISVLSEAYDPTAENREIFIEEDFEANLEDDLESAIKRKWEQIIGDGTEIVVANLTKLRELGISLEGTVDVEGGVELRPHHYIRSILPQGPVGQNGRLSAGDELLEVNGQKLVGIKHVDVVNILRELPGTVRLVCARKHDGNRVMNTSRDIKAFEARNIVGGSLKNLMVQSEGRILKASSDISVNTSSTISVSDEPNLEKSKSRSLEALSTPMWSSKIDYIELHKGHRGLGFSILDYQDPEDPTSTVIVIRSIVPFGAAEQDGRICAGDQLVSVNDEKIKNFTLDEAVQLLKRALPGGTVRLGICKPHNYFRQNESPPLLKKSPTP